MAEHHRPLGPRCVHHGAGVVHADLEGREPVLGHAVREPHASLVEDQYPSERGQAPQEPLDPRLVPHALDVRDPSEYEDQIDGAVAQYLIRDVDAIGGLRVLGLGGIHPRILSVSTHGVQTDLPGDGGAPPGENAAGRAGARDKL